MAEPVPQLVVKHPPSLAEVRVHRPAQGRRIAVWAIFIALHAVCLQVCIQTSGQPYATALAKLKEKNRQHHLNGTKQEDRPPDDPLPMEGAPNEWAAAALFFSLSGHALFHLLCHWRVRFRATMLFQPAQAVSDGCWFEVKPLPHRGREALVPAWRAGISGHLCIEFQRQRYEYHSLEAGTEEDNDDFCSGPGELRLTECPVELQIKEYLSAKGLSEDEVEDLKDRFGPNVLKVATPSFLRCYREQLATPLVVFQFFIAMLWAADDFLGYTLTQLLVILVFESTSVFQRIHTLKTLNAMGTKPYDVKVYREGAWTTVSTVDLLPGDLVQLALEAVEEPSVVATTGKDAAKPSAPTEVLATDIVPCDCVILRGDCVVNEATITGESVPQMKDAVTEDDRALDYNGSDRCHSLFSGSRLLRSSLGTSRQAEAEEGTFERQHLLPDTPDGGCLCFVLRTGFYSSQGELLQVIEFSRQTVSGDSKEIMVALLILTCFALAAAGYVLKKGLEQGDRTPHELIIKCVIILTSVVPRQLPMQMSLAVNAALMSMVRAGVYCTEPFRVPVAGKITHCLFDKTGTLTTDSLVPAGVINASSDAGEVGKIGGVQDASPDAALVLAACHALVAEGRDGRGEKLTGDPIEVAALHGVGWHYNATESVAQPGNWKEAEKKVELLRSEIEKLQALPPQEKRQAEATRKAKEETLQSAEAALLAQRNRAEKSPIAAVRILRRFHFASKLQRMSVVAEVEAREAADENPRSGQHILVKGSPEALKPLLEAESVPSWFETAYLEMAENGQRVLALALRKLTSSEEAEDLVKLSRSQVENKLLFVGFIAFECQTRSDSRLVISSLRESGHRVMMITGDAPLTALHVAKQCDIVPSERESLVLRPRGDAAENDKPGWFVATGKRRGEAAPAGRPHELAESFALVATEDALEAAEAADPGLWDEAVAQIAIFARMTPSGKAKVIRTLQKQGGFTLMCGDGGNDTGALKEADVGLALLAGHGEVNTSDALSTAPPQTQQEKSEVVLANAGPVIKTAEEALNARQQEISQRAKDVQKLRQQFLREKQKELQKLQQTWLEQELKALAERGENGIMAQGSAVKAVLGRFTAELKREMHDFDLRHGNVYDGDPKKNPITDGFSLESDGSTEGGSVGRGGVPLARPGEASVAAPFTSRVPSVKGTVDLIRQGRCTLLSALQQQQVMMMNAIINAFVLSIISLEGSRRSERQLIASEWLLTTASLSFSYASACDRMHPVRPVRSLFNPAIFISMLGQAAIHLVCLHTAVSMAREVMADNSSARQQGWEGPSLPDVKEFWRKQRLIRRGVIAKQEEELDWYQQAMMMWFSPFLPNLMNTVVFLVETAQTVAVLMVNYKGQPWMKGLLENRPLFFSVFVIVGGIAAAAWQINSEANVLLHLSPFPSDEFRWKIMGLVGATLFGTFFWDRICTAVFAPENFRAMLESAKSTTFQDDILPVCRCFVKVCAGFAAVALLGGVGQAPVATQVGPGPVVGQ